MESTINTPKEIRNYQRTGIPEEFPLSIEERLKNAEDLVATDGTEDNDTQE
jgi:hypothetical protein